MTAEAAIYNFFSGFGITAYPETAVPDDRLFPYLTYTNTTPGGFDGDPASITVQLWYYTESESEPNAKAREIFEKLKDGGVILKCDGGAIWLYPGSPWCQAIVEEEDRTLKRRYINISRVDHTA